MLTSESAENQGTIKKKRRFKLMSIRTFLLAIPISVAFGLLIMMLSNEIKLAIRLNNSKSQGEPTSYRDYANGKCIYSEKDLQFLQLGLSQTSLDINVFMKQNYPELEYYGLNSDLQFEQLFDSKIKQQAVRDWIAQSEKAYSQIKTEIEQLKNSSLLYQGNISNKFENNRIKTQFYYTARQRLIIFIALLDWDYEKIMDTFSEMADDAILWNRVFNNEVYLSQMLSLMQFEETLKTVTECRFFTEDELLKLIKDIDRLIPLLSLKQALIKHRSQLFEWLQRDIEEIDNLVVADFRNSWYSHALKPLVRYGVIKTIDLTNELIELSDEPYWIARKKVSAVYKKYETYIPHVAIVKDWHRLHILSQSYAIEGLTKLLIAKSSLASIVIKRRHNRLPTGIKELIDERLVSEDDATDPFIGKFLQFRVVDDEVIIYSVGFDERDDSNVESGNQSKEDIFWEEYSD